MTLSAISSSAPKSDPSADKSPSMKDDETTSGSQQKPKPDVDVVPKDTDLDHFFETGRPKAIKTGFHTQVKAAMTEGVIMSRYSPAARTNYSVKSNSARHREKLASGINLDDDSSVEDEDEMDDEEETEGEEDVEEEELERKEVMTTDDSMEDEKASNDGENLMLQYKAEETAENYKAHVPTLRTTFSDKADMIFSQMTLQMPPMGKPVERLSAKPAANVRHQGSSSLFIPKETLTHQKLIQELSKSAHDKKVGYTMASSRNVKGELSKFGEKSITLQCPNEYETATCPSRQVSEQLSDECHRSFIQELVKNGRARLQ